MDNKAIKISEKENLLKTIDIDLVLQDPEVKKVYANGFLLHIGPSDMMLLPTLNDSPIQVLNLSYTTAKSLSLVLNRGIKLFEETTGVHINSSDEFSKAMQKLKPLKNDTGDSK